MGQMEIGDTLVKFFTIQQASFVQNSSHVFYVNGSSRKFRRVRGKQNDGIACRVSVADVRARNVVFREPKSQWPVLARILGDSPPQFASGAQVRHLR
jgi:hypothetical protein